MRLLNPGLEISASVGKSLVPRLSQNLNLKAADGVFHVVDGAFGIFGELGHRFIGSANVIGAFHNIVHAVLDGGGLIAQLAGLLQNRTGSFVHFVRALADLLGYAVHVAQGFKNLLRASVLLEHGRADFPHEIFGFTNALDYHAKRLTRGFRAFYDVVDGVANQNHFA